MKTKIYLSTLLMMLLCGSVFISCSKDDDKDGGDSGSIEGYWLRENTSTYDNRFYYFHFMSNHYRRVIIEQDEDGNIVDKETEEGTISIDGNKLVMKSSSSPAVTFKYSLTKNWLKLNIIDTSTEEVLGSIRMSKITESMFNQMWNAKVENPYSINRQWMTTDVKIVNPAYDKYFSALVLDLTDNYKGYLMGCMKETSGGYLKDRWYVITEAVYNVLPYTNKTGKIGYASMEYEYVLGKYSLDLTLVSKSLTAHYDAVVDVEPEGKFTF